MAMAAPIRGMLFQSIRELIMNALKHAGPCTVHVDVTFAVGQILIRVQDDGVGFDTAKLDQHDIHQGGFGLFGVRQRLENLGGCLEIESAPGKGAIATLNLPLKDSCE
jgi:signal transduction histidine kinase